MEQTFKNRLQLEVLPEVLAEGEVAMLVPTAAMRPVQAAAEAEAERGIQTQILVLVPVLAVAGMETMAEEVEAGVLMSTALRPVTMVMEELAGSAVGVVPADAEALADTAAVEALAPEGTSLIRQSPEDHLDVSGDGAATPLAEVALAWGEPFLAILEM